jgi:signal transduction histidine kinase
MTNSRSRFDIRCPRKRPPIVTLKLLKEEKYDRRLPRSTFLCPAYVAGEEVGGMAFACGKVIARRPALIGEAISTTLLTYLRLREDALAQRIAEDKEMVDQAKRFLLNRFVHDFRHPVEALQSAVKETRDSLTSIEKQLSHVNRMMNETIFAFEGRDPKQLLKAKKKPDNVAEFMADIEFFFKKRFDQQGKHLEVVRSDPKWYFNIDRGMLHELLENLIANALEHGGGNVQLSVEKKGGDYLIHVKDDGKGIPAAAREEMSRGLLRKPTTMKGGRVHGRGLMISKMLAQSHGGDLWPGEGDDVWKTDFVVKIPGNKKTGGKDAPKNSVL